MRDSKIQVDQKGTENPGSLLKRFTRRVSRSGLLRKARSLRYATRPDSEFKKKSQALRRLNRQAEYERLDKLGKAPLRGRGRRR